jgi:hypothetical protein
MRSPAKLIFGIILLIIGSLMALIQLITLPNTISTFSDLYGNIEDNYSRGEALGYALGSALLTLIAVICIFFGIRLVRRGSAPKNPWEAK